MIIHDIPLTKASEDKFGRGPIVEQVVDSINQLVSSDHDCVVYGIYGKWGEGKTSLMNFIKERLINQKEDDGILLIEFNPWLVNNDEALLREFFKSIMKGADESIRGVIKKYGSLAILASKSIVNAFFPGIGDALANGISMAKDALIDTEDTLSGLKTRASDAIIKSDKHLVIMIDDVDRLDKEELHAVLRLIRLVADFKNCIYIVAMDVDMVAKSIGSYHGNGNSQDGRHFLDKIVQVPITLPKVPKYDMQKLIEKELATALHNFSEGYSIDEITNAVVPFINTYRELKRFCNQLEFVLPHLKDEVNIKELCLIEAIKMVNAESYKRIFECRSQLMHEDSSFGRLVDPDKEKEEVENRYKDAKKYIEEGLYGARKEAVENAIELLFERSSIDYQGELDKKRLLTDVYFPKYFSLLVPSDLIPDRELDDFRTGIIKSKIDRIASRFNEWKEQYSASEVKRAALYLIRKSDNGADRCVMASLIAKSLSVSNLTKNYPPHVSVDADNMAAFIVHQVIHPNMFSQDPQYARMIVFDVDVLDDTMSFIFREGEINFCMNVLGTSEGHIFSNVVYDGRNVLPTLAKRFFEIGFKQQFKFSKFLLVTFLNRWKRVDPDSFGEYANDLFNNKNNDLGRIFNKFIDGTDDANNVVLFVGLFNHQVQLINKRLEGESEEVRSSRAVKVYASNYRPLIESNPDE